MHRDRRRDTRIERSVERATARAGWCSRLSLRARRSRSGAGTVDRFTRSLPSRSDGLPPARQAAGRGSPNCRATALAGTASENAPQLPPVLGGLVIEEAREAGWTRRGRSAGAGIVRDRREGTLSATLRVRGREFALCERAAQERQLHLWGDALAAFCMERGPVARLRWTEWAAPAGLDASLAYLDEHSAHDDSSDAVTLLPRPARAGRPDVH